MDLPVHSYRQGNGKQVAWSCVAAEHQAFKIISSVQSRTRDVNQHRWPQMAADRSSLSQNAAWLFPELCVTCLGSLCVKGRAPPWRTALASRPPLNLISAGSRAEQRLFGRAAVWKWLCCGGAPVRAWRSERGFCCSSWLPFPLRVVLQLRETTRRREIGPRRGTRAPTIQLTLLLTKRLSPSCPSTTTTSGSPLRSLCGSSWHCWWSLVSETWSKWMNEWIFPAGKMIKDLYPFTPIWQGMAWTEGGSQFSKYSCGHMFS